MSKLSRSDALERISRWSTDDVLRLLQKNDLEDCCAAIAKRQIDGDELLHLTEGKLALWKSDLTRPLIWQLWTLVEDIKKTPEKYAESNHFDQQIEDRISDAGSWDTDFEDEVTEDSAELLDMKNVNIVTIKKDVESNQKLQKETNNMKITMQRDNKIEENDKESTYANCDSFQDQENTYANCQDDKNPPPKNVSRLHNSCEKSLVEQLKEQLKLWNTKPAIGPKPNVMISKRIENNSSARKLPQKSFLHNESNAKQRHLNKPQKRMAVPPPPEPKKNTEQANNDYPKPPISIKNLDLLANLPARTDESEDEYESFDEQLIEQNQKAILSRIDSKHSLTSGPQSSVESVYQPLSTTSHEEEEEQYEIYESITETPEDQGYYLSPIQKSPHSNTLPPPLPIKPPKTPSPTPSQTKLEKPSERSPDKKSATLPYPGSNTSLLSERVTRPLPPPPDGQSYIDKPWFHNVSREQAIVMITEQSTYGNPQDGYFLLRPSTTNANNPLALVLWCNDRVYNVPVRKRPDNRYALGSAKVNEQSFSNIEEIVTFYTKEILVLYTGGVQTGSTKLTDTPSK